MGSNLKYSSVWIQLGCVTESMYTPLNPDAFRDAMKALFELLKKSMVALEKASVTRNTVPFTFFHHVFNNKL